MAVCVKLKTEKIFKKLIKSKEIIPHKIKMISFFTNVIIRYLKLFTKYFSKVFLRDIKKPGK